MCDTTFSAKSLVTSHMESVHEGKKAKSGFDSTSNEESDQALNKKLEKIAKSMPCSKIRANYVKKPKSARNYLANCHIFRQNEVNKLYI